jgi:FAD/FMN-containing dehydrogenase
VISANTTTDIYFKDLAANLTGDLLLPNDEAYDETRQLWNQRVDKRPAALVRSTSVGDVIHAVQWARSQGLPLSVRAGGHDFGGRSLCDGGVVIDCSRMRTVSIDPVRRRATVQGGATIGDLIVAAQKHGLATTTGTISSVGLGGLTLGGGYGPLLGKFGLVADNLLSAQVVTADGRLLTADVKEHPDLYWALRGGGGNFGVMVSMEYRLYPISQVLSGLLLYSLDRARAVLRYYNEFIQTVPDELTIQPGFIRVPELGTVLFLSPTWCGPLEEGERILEPLRSFFKPLTDQIKAIPYDALVYSIDSLAPKGRRYFLQTQSLPGLSDESIAELIELAQRFSSPLSLLSLHHFHGAASRIAISDTAFGVRRDHLMVEIVAAWEPQPAKEDDEHVRWARDGSRRLAPYALPGGYVNLLDVTEQERIPAAFGTNYPRLLEIKRTYDPEDAFRSTIGHVPAR